MFLMSTPQKELLMDWKNFSPNEGITILTVLLSGKWSDIYLLKPSGEIKGVLENNLVDLGDDWWGSSITPKGFIRAAIELDAKITYDSYRQVVHKFITEGLGTIKPHREYMPKKEDLYKVVLKENYDIAN